MNRAFAAFALGAFLHLAGSARAQTCTLGPFTGAISLAAIESEINASPDGAVVCLRRGELWSRPPGEIGLQMTSGHPDAGRVTLCSSDDTECTDSNGGANAQLQTDDADCLAFTTDADGYTVKNIDCTGTNTCELYHSVIEQLDPGNRDLRFEGGVFDGYAHLNLAYTQASGNPTNIDFGTCANRIEVRNCHSGQARWLLYGACTDCSFSLWVHDWGSNEPGGDGQAHVLDFSFWLAGDAPSQDVLIECNLWEIDCGTARQMGSAINASYGAGMTFRDNVVRNVDPVKHCGAGLHFDAHAGDVDVGWDGAEIYRNEFDMGADVGWVIVSKLGANLNIYNNLFKLLGTAGAGEHGQVLHIEEEGAVEPPGVPLAPNRVRFFNNTIRTDEADLATLEVFAGTGHEIFNNLIINATLASHGTDDTPGAEIFLTDDCGRFGANGAKLHHNLVHAPNDSIPLYTPCSGASWLPGAPWQTETGLDDSAAGDFDLAGFSSYAWGRGTPIGAPNDDHGGLPRPTPPSIGADDIWWQPAAPACGIGPELLVALPVLGALGVGIGRRGRNRTRTEGG